MGELEVWRGGVNPWQCDQMGHLNVRFYVSHAIEGLAGIAAALGMSRAFAPRATSTLVVREHHIRFVREARVGDPLHMMSGVLEVGADDARLLQTLIHSPGGQPAAVFQTRVAHARAADGQPFPWSSAARDEALALGTQVPAGLGARSIEPGQARADASLALADQLELALHGAGLFGVEDCDAFGRVAAHQIMGRLGDGAAHAIAAARAAAKGLLPGDPPIGLAVLEYRLTYLAWPAAGDRFEVRSALSEAAPRRLRFEHWVLDPASGRPWALAEVVLVVFDLDQRKTVTLPDDAVATLLQRLPTI